MNAPAITVRCDKRTAPETFAALERVLGPHGITLLDVSAVDPAHVSPTAQGLMVWLDGRFDHFRDSFGRLWEAQCRSFLVYSPIPNHMRLWSALPSDQRHTFREAWVVCLALNPALIADAIRKNAVPGNWVLQRLDEFLTARKIYELLRRFSHGRKADLTNEFLGPARLLLLRNRVTSYQITNWKALWSGGRGFHKSVLRSPVLDQPALGAEVKTACEPICNWFSNNSGSSSPDPSDLESLMLLLTKIRTLAGEKSRTRGADVAPNKPVEPVCLQSNHWDDCFRILVVDDHAEAWRPIFQALAEELNAAGLVVSFEFSLDGEEAISRGGTTVGPIAYGFYDLVILDVFLGKADGRDILNKIRRDFPHLPVLLWTTSRDEEITAEASMANGILLKKTVGWEQLREAITKWIIYGNVLGANSLPTPFFNNAIRGLDHRKLARNFHEWCLKELDSFHALDGEYFRYFTDHGGRHIIKMWELLEQALKPFLKPGDELLLPEDLKAREFELLGLYLAVICHELGMFPMKIGDQVENFARVGRDYLIDVRVLHAPRGMVLLHQGSKRDGKVYWNDEPGRELGDNLVECHPACGTVSLGDFLAVLVGYHARFFRSLQEDAFLKWNRVEAGVRNKLNKLLSPTASLGRADVAFKESFEALDQAVADVSLRERLRRQCALFRFVDAIDVSASRNPASFLIGSEILRPQQYLEFVKREVCTHVSIRRGIIRAEVCAFQPKPRWVKQAVKAAYKFELVKEDAEASKAAAARSKVTDLLASRRLSSMLDRPWALALEKKRSVKTKLESISDSILLIQSALEAWLAEVWRTLVDPLDADEVFVKCIREMGVLEAKLARPKLSKQGSKIIASITALSMAGELLDEYQAVIESELDKHLRLVSFKWAEEQDWSNGLPKGLITLQKVREGSNRTPV